MQILHFTYAEIAPHLCRNCVLGVQNLRTNKIYNLKYYARVTTTITTVIYLPFLPIKRVRARASKMQLIEGETKAQFINLPPCGMLTPTLR